LGVNIAELGLSDSANELENLCPLSPINAYVKEGSSDTDLAVINRIKCPRYIRIKNSVVRGPEELAK
jgi:hypothetical protein